MSQQDIYDYLKKRNGTVVEIAKATGVCRSSIDNCMSQLYKWGLVRIVGYRNPLNNYGRGHKTRIWGLK